jgi:hypothetical protein
MEAWADWKSSKMVLLPRRWSLVGFLIRQSSASRYAFFSRLERVCLRGGGDCQHDDEKGIVIE